MTPELTHERVLLAAGARTGLPIAVAVHSTVLGPALGGARMWRYPSWREGLDDALRLASAMTLKNAAAGLDAGGGKSVIVLPPERELSTTQRHDALLDLGDIVESLGGTYRTAEDVGTSPGDMRIVAQRTAHVVGLPTGDGGSGDPSHHTAAGVLAAVHATAYEVFGDRTLAGRTAVVIGLGNVGTALTALLVNAGAAVAATDIDPRRRDIALRLGASWVEPDAAIERKADLLIPAGVGGQLTSSVIDRLAVRAVVGPANNPLAAPEGADQLDHRGIVYAPDFIVNAGGVLHLGLTAEGASGQMIAERIAGIEGVLSAVFAAARADGITPLDAARRLAEERLRTPAPV